MAEPDGLDGQWLVVVDMQDVFADPASDWCTPGFATIVPAIQRLIRAFSARVVFTRFIAPRTPTGAWRDYYAQWPFALQTADAPLWRIVPELLDSGRPVVDAPTFGKWRQLQPLVGKADGLVVTGVSTDCCVLSTVLGAADDGMAVRVVADACAGLSEPDHQRALDAMSLYTPLVQITDEASVLGWQ